MMDLLIRDFITYQAKTTQLRKHRQVFECPQSTVIENKLCQLRKFSEPLPQVLANSGKIGLA